MVLSQTLSWLRDRGVYSPVEIARVSSGESTDWAASECLRLLCLVVVLKAAIREMEGGMLAADEYQVRAGTILAGFTRMGIARDLSGKDS